MSNIDYANVQGIVLGGYGRMSSASYYLLSEESAGAAKAWLQEQLRTDAISHGNVRLGTSRLNVAYTASGLRKLGATDTSLQSFDRAFVAGMANDRRARILGDIGENHHSHWLWGGVDSSVDLLVAVFSQDNAIHAQSLVQMDALFQTLGLSVVARMDTVDINLHSTTPDNREHFGFADGLSQPIIKGFPGGDSPELDRKITPEVATGEFLLGYENEYERFTRIPRFKHPGATFGRNGSYVVVRQMQQHVSRFWNAMQSAGEEIGESAEYVGSKVVGRWPNGALVLPDDKQAPGTEISNNFDFSADPDGLGCPLGAHIRRNNPRATDLSVDAGKSLRIANRHRILRRGRRYGPRIEDPYNPDGVERGLVFLCLNANIERQFEFLQHSWVNNPKFPRLYDEDDPLIGTAGLSPRRFTIPAKPYSHAIKGFNQFVTIRGGAYFFLPSMTALHQLADDT